MKYCVNRIIYLLTSLYLLFCITYSYPDIGYYKDYPYEYNISSVYTPLLLSPGTWVNEGQYELKELIDICDAGGSSPVYSNFGLLPGPVKQELYELIEVIHESSKNLLPAPSKDIKPVNSEAVIERKFIQKLMLKLPEEPELVYETIIGRGSFGEVWKAFSKKENHIVILKRLFIEKGEKYQLSGRREIHFGILLKNEKKYITRFIDYFTVRNIKENELWLVYEYEGLSLRSIIYNTNDDGMQILSPIWHSLRSSLTGYNLFRLIIYNVVKALYICHNKYKILYRDLKPDNILINMNIYPITVKLCDFGSAVDEYTILNHLFSPLPSLDEESVDYQPPEVLFHNNVVYDLKNPYSYDIWSFGITILEIYLGTSKVFDIDERTKILIRRKLHTNDEKILKQAYILHGLREYCISPDQSLKCSYSDIYRATKARDPLNHGIEDRNLFSLLSQLLKWNSSERITSEQILKHPFFNISQSLIEIPSKKMNSIPTKSTKVLELSPPQGLPIRSKPPNCGYMNSPIHYVKKPKGVIKMSPIATPSTPIKTPNALTSSVFTFDVLEQNSKQLPHLETPKRLKKCMSQPSAFMPDLNSPLITPKNVKKKIPPIKKRKSTLPENPEEIKKLATEAETKELKELLNIITECLTKYENIFKCTEARDNVETTVNETKNVVSMLCVKVNQFSRILESAEIMYKMINLIIEIFNSFLLSDTISLSFQILYNTTIQLLQSILDNKIFTEPIISYPLPSKLTETILYQLIKSESSYVITFETFLKKLYMNFPNYRIKMETNLMNIYSIFIEDGDELPDYIDKLWNISIMVFAYKYGNVLDENQIIFYRLYLLRLLSKSNIYLYDKEYTKFVNEFLDKDEECNLLMCKYICKIYKNDNWKNEDLQLRVLYRSAFNLNDHYVLPFELASKIVKLLLYSMKTNKIQLHDDYVLFVNGWFIIYLVPLCDFDTTLKDQFDMYCCNRDELENYSVCYDEFDVDTKCK